MTALDYYQNPSIVEYMALAMSRITRYEDREDCRQEIFAELYDFMPLDIEEAKRIVKRIAMRFERGTKRLEENEMSLNSEDGYFI